MVSASEATALRRYTNLIIIIIIIIIIFFRPSVDILLLLLLLLLLLSKLVPFKSMGTVSYSPSIVTMAVSVAVCEIFSFKEWCDLENRVSGSVVERRSLTGELSLSCARPVADG